MDTVEEKAVLVLSTLKLSDSVLKEIFETYSGCNKPVSVFNLNTNSNDLVIHKVLKEVKQFGEVETYYHGVITDPLAKLIERVETMLG